MADEQADVERLRRLAADSQDRDVLLVEVVWGAKWARFDISRLELQHLEPAELWRRHVEPALQAVEAPSPVGGDILANCR